MIFIRAFLRNREEGDLIPPDFGSQHKVLQSVRIRGLFFLLDVTRVECTLAVSRLHPDPSKRLGVRNLFYRRPVLHSFKLKSYFPYDSLCFHDSTLWRSVWNFP